MADAPNAPEAKGGSGMVGKIVMFAGSVVVAVALALGIFTYVIAPKLGLTGQHAEGEHSTETGEEVVEEGSIPATAVEVHFGSPDPDITTVVMEDPGTPASMLVYKLTLVCLNKETAKVIEAKKAYFRTLITDLHSFRKREELIGNSKVKEEIEEQIVKECNIQLIKLRNVPISSGEAGGHGGGGGEPEVIPADVKLRVLEALHEMFVVQDSP
jgi:flagellar basal body-associated protein FliL